MDIGRARLLKIIKEAWLPNIEVSGMQALRFVDQLIAKGVTVQTESKTNADRIRAMSDAELADFIIEAEACGNEGVSIADWGMTMLEWLKQPAAAKSNGKAEAGR